MLYNDLVSLGCKDSMRSKKNLGDKPYNRCLYCKKRRCDPSECNGPRTSSMTTDRWREYMRDLKDVEGLTYEELSERTGGQLSAPSIQNSLAPGASGDITREKARLIENAVFGVSVAPPCPFDFIAEMSADGKRVMDLEAELEQLRSNISRIHDSYEKELETVRADAQKKLDYLLSENQRLHKMIDRLLD